MSDHNNMIYLINTKQNRPMTKKSSKTDVKNNGGAQERNQALRTLPGVDSLFELLAEGRNWPKSVAVRAARTAIEIARAEIVSGRAPVMDKKDLEARVAAMAEKLAGEDMRENLRNVVNGTGVVVHTNLGRSLLSPLVCENIAAIANRYSNLEFDLTEGRRGSRHSVVEDLLCELTGAEAAMAVNNNAGAVLLCLQALARDREVVVSRGELVEIGGSFRIPDVMSASGAILKEVGTTNRTHARDYETAIGENTAMLLKAHTSNFAVVGFTASVSLKELVEIGRGPGVIVMEDLGSGSLIDLSRYGLTKEPTVGESVAAGADLVTFSGDKMLGGPQAGIIVGKKKAVDLVKKHPVARALRNDKLTLAALESTLRLYRDPAACVEHIPTLKMLTEKPETIQKRARRLQTRVRKMSLAGLTVRTMKTASRVGGGALPLQELPSYGVGVSIEGLSANAVEKAMRRLVVPVIGRIEEDVFLLDMRTISNDEIPLAAKAVKAVAESSMDKR